MKIYMAGPINGCSDSEAQDWRNAISSMLTDCECIDPMKRDYRGKEASNYREIVDLDKLDVARADYVVVMYTKPSVGTSMEIYHAWLKGIPVLLIDAQDKPLSPWLVYHSTVIVTSISEACEKIKFWSLT